MYKITIFNSQKTSGKKPISPYGDETFDFQTIEVNEPMDLFRILSKEFILNISLDLKEPTRLRRRKQDLEKYYPETTNCVIIDVDHIASKANQLEILKYFKKYKCILGESRSCNNIDNFNLKGFLFIKPIELFKLKPLLEQLHDDLAKYGDIDMAPSHKAKLNAPMNKVVILLESNEPEYEFTLRLKNVSKKSFECMTDIPKDLDLSEVDSIDKLCLRVFESLGFEALKANNECIIFKHISELKSPGGFYWFKDNPYVMHHYNELRTVNLFDKISKLPEAKELLKKQINYDNELLKYNTNTKLININTPYLEVTDEIRDCVDSFISRKDGLFAIKSPMGTAKSTLIEEIIRQSKNNDLRVLLCSNRISVAQDFSKKYNIKLYNRDSYNPGDSLIVQYDSLWKYNIRLFDIVILDEFVSVMLHARNNLTNSSINLSKLFACLRKKLVIADAFLTGYENNLLSFKKDNVYMVQNDYRDETNLFEYENFNCFVQSILIHSKKHKTTISCTSLVTIKALKKLLEKYNLNVITLTSETPQITKDLIYKIFETENSDKYDVLIYSPTLTVGVSNLNNIDVHFHYDTANTCDTISSLQMIKRTRKAKEIHYFIKNTINYNLKTNFNAIKSEYLENVGKQIELNFLFDLNDYGEPKLSRLGKGAIYIDLFRNILEFNHKNSFIYLLQYQFKNKPVLITKKFETNILLPYINETKKETNDKNSELLDEYMALSEEGDLPEFKNNSIFEILFENEKYIIEGTPLEIKKEILQKEILNKGLISKCRRYNIINEYSKTLDKRQIQIEISNDILHNVENVYFWNNVLKYIKVPLELEYKINDVPNKVKKILDDCGYKKLANKCERLYGVSEEILKYKDYVC